MGRPCTVCTHKRRDEIDADILSPGPTRYEALRATYGLSKDAVFRHKRDHIAKAIRVAPTLADITRGDSLLAQVCHLRERALAILERAEGAGQLKIALGAIREARECLTLLGRLLGSFHEDSVKIDARTQIIANLNQLSIDELRALAAPTLRTAEFGREEK